MYHIGSIGNNDIVKEIDSLNIINKLIDIYPELKGLNNIDLGLKLKEMIKCKETFNFHIKILQISPEEYITNLIYLFPQIWKHHLIKHCRKEYLK